MQIKSWESPRRRGRNDKGKGGSARQRQLKKRDKMLINKLKRNNSDHKGGEISPLFFIVCESSETIGTGLLLGNA